MKLTLLAMMIVASVGCRSEREPQRETAPPEEGAARTNPAPTRGTTDPTGTSQYDEQRMRGESSMGRTQDTGPSGTGAGTTQEGTQDTQGTGATNQGTQGTGTPNQGTQGAPNQGTGAMADAGVGAISDAGTMAPSGTGDGGTSEMGTDGGMTGGGTSMPDTNSDTQSRPRRRSVH